MYTTYTLNNVTREYIAYLVMRELFPWGGKVACFSTKAEEKLVKIDETLLWRA